MNNIEDSLLQAIQKEWAWAVERPQKLFKWNEFGNIIILDVYKEYHRIIPEHLEVVKIGSEKELYQKFEDNDFLIDWRMDALVQIAKKAYGEIEENECYGFKMWPIFQGVGYGIENIVKKKSMVEWVSASGNMGNQIKVLPNGSKIKIGIGKNPV